MFSGIIEKVGKVENIEGNILRIKSDEIARSVEISESVSVSGACLTVIDVEKRNGFFTVNVIPETYSRTNFRSLSKGSEVNLETALTVTSSTGDAGSFGIIPNKKYAKLLFQYCSIFLCRL